MNEEEEVIDLTRKRKRQDDDEDDEDVEVETRKRKRCAKVSIYHDYYRVISNLLVSRQVFHICNIIVSGTGLREDKPFHFIFIRWRKLSTSSFCWEYVHLAAYVCYLTHA